MTGDQTAHITVSYRDSDAEITGVYAVNEHISRELGHHMRKPVGKELAMWLEKKGCRLDSPDGPALVRRTTDGATGEAYYRDGKYHRQGGPAISSRHADGSTEEYYRDGRLHRKDGPALVWRYANGSMVERYYRDGKLHREDGPAFVQRWADGTTTEEYFRDNRRYREDTTA